METSSAVFQPNVHSCFFFAVFSRLGNKRRVDRRVRGINIHTIWNKYNVTIATSPTSHREVRVHNLIPPIDERTTLTPTITTRSGSFLKLSPTIVYTVRATNPKTRSSILRRIHELNPPRPRIPSPFTPRISKCRRKTPPPQTELPKARVRPQSPR
jgi:hypothetical protein